MSRNGIKAGPSKNASESGRTPASKVVSPARRLFLLLIAIGLCSCADNLNRSSTAHTAPVVRLQGRPRGVSMTKAKEAPSDHVMNMELEFAMHNQAEFDQLMNQINDPHSKRYQQWLTPEEMHSRFGESKADFDAVLSWLRSQGFSITDQSYDSNEDYIRFSGTVAQVDKAFQVHIMEPDFELYAPAEDPVIPAQFAGIVSRIDGMDNVGFRSSD